MVLSRLGRVLKLMELRLARIKINLLLRDCMGMEMMMMIENAI